MANTIQIRRGSKASLPTLAQGELAFCTDTDDVFIGDGVGNVQLGNVVGPSSAVTDGHLVVWDGATGRLVKDAGVAPYSLPTASVSVLGGVKVGTGLSITDGVLAATGGSGMDAATVNSLIFAQTY